jgi:serine/threonine-protein kinase
MHQNTLFAAPFDLGRLVVTGAPQPVLEDVSNNALFGSANFEFSQTGTFVYVSWKGEMPWSLFWLDSRGNTQPVHLRPGLYHYPRLSPDGKRLAFVTGQGGRTNIWVHDLERDITSLLSHLPGLNHFPVWTPDGKNIFFQSLYQPSPGLYRILTDAPGEPQRLTEGGERPHSFSPDGKQLAYDQGSADISQREIWTAPVEGYPEHPRLGKGEPFLRASFSASLPAFSPDGRWLAYQSNETGTNEVYVRPFPGPGATVKISNGGGRDPIWSSGAGAGHELFFLGLDGRIMVVDYTVSRDSFGAGKPQVWWQNSLPYEGVFLPFDLALGGKRFVVALYPGGKAEDQNSVDTVTVVLNFFDELRRRVPGGK